MNSEAPLAPEAKRWKGRIQFLGVATLFMAPILTAFWLNLAPQTVTELTSGGRTNHGELVKGAPKLPLDGLRPASADTDLPTLQGTWTLISINDRPACDETCGQAIYVTRQVRWALGKEIDRVKRVHVEPASTTADALLQAAERLAPEAGLTFVLGTDGWLSGLAAHLPPSTDITQHVFVVDPDGRLVLSFPLSAEAGGLLKDMKRLLRLSKIG